MRRLLPIVGTIALIITTIPSFASVRVSSDRTPIHVYREDLNSGAVVLEMRRNGEQIARFVVDQGSEVTLWKSTAADGAKGAISFGIKPPPEPTSRSELLERAAAYARAGRSPEADEAILAIPGGPSKLSFVWIPPDKPVDLTAHHSVTLTYASASKASPAAAKSLSAMKNPAYGLDSANVKSPTIVKGYDADTASGGNLQVVTAAKAGESSASGGSIWSSGCGKIAYADVYWSGCYRRLTVSDSDPNNWYTGDASQASGHGGNCCVRGLEHGDTRFNYEAGTVVAWQPGGDMPTGECVTRTIGINYSGLSMSDSFRLCPERIVVLGNGGSRSFGSAWLGHTHWDRTGTVGTAHEVITRVRNGASSGFSYTGAALWCDRC